MTPRLTILLGAGGVGKTTLSAALGVALARAGEHAGLLSVDPACRLRSALGLAELPEAGVAVPLHGRPGSLDAAMLDPSASLRRWVAADCPDDDARARVLVSPYFVALADHLAGLGDAIGCARAAEWAERDPALTELVLDTAPGMPALELLSRPDKLMEFFDGRMIRWITRLAKLSKLGLVGRGAHRVLHGIAEVSGMTVLREFGELLTAVDRAVATMIVRLERVRRWLKEPTTSLVIVCSVNDDAAEAARALDLALRDLGFAPSLVVLNRTLPAALADVARLRADAPAEARAFARYVTSYLRIQDRVRAQLTVELTRVIDLPDAVALDGAGRLDGLAALGEPLRAQLVAQRAAPRRVATGPR